MKGRDLHSALKAEVIKKINAGNLEAEKKSNNGRAPK
jgi:hypothetical protein